MACPPNDAPPFRPVAFPDHCRTLAHPGGPRQSGVLRFLFHPRAFPALPDQGPPSLQARVVLPPHPHRRAVSLVGLPLAGGAPRPSAELLEGAEEVYVRDLPPALAAAYFPVLLGIELQAHPLPAPGAAAARPAHRQVP